MGLHRALLIGASDYEMRGVQPLPFVPGDLTRLGAILTSHGFNDVQVMAKRPGGKQISRNYVNSRVVGFLRRARPGDTVFILLSGHGVHARGQDYLVPEDIDEDVHPFESGCVPIDWRQHLDETPADHVVFLIDACREGIEQDSMSVAGVREWGRQQITAALRRKVAYVYGCSPAQLSLFVRPHERVQDGREHGTRPGESFSIFSRSIADVVLSHPAGRPLALGAFKDAVQDRVTELHRAYRKRGEPQLLRIVTDISTNDFFFLPGSGIARPAQPRPAVVRSDPATMSISAPATVAPAPTPRVAPAPTPTVAPAALPSVFGPPMPAPPTRPPAEPRTRARFRIRWTRRNVVAAAVATTVVAGGLTGSYLWTRTQVYVGAQGDHVAIYQGISQDVLGISLSKVTKDHPEIELKYLPPYQAKQVRATIAEGDNSSAQAKVNELAVQASACKKEAERRASDGKEPKLSSEESKVVSLCSTS